jgi:hypothetical protein
MTLPLSAATRASLERALERQTTTPFYYVEELSATMARIVCPDDPEKGRTFVNMARWMLAADDAIRAAYNRAIDDVLALHLMRDAGNEEAAFAAQLYDTIAALRQETPNEQ